RPQKEYASKRHTTYLMLSSPSLDTLLATILTGAATTSNSFENLSFVLKNGVLKGIKNPRKATKHGKDSKMRPI
ncbi:MAG: hypothetical protein IKX21_08080, partial [Deltaproteobacteria bacterium]|nr:hypothetical protein [Deltaproteobacteria bacterium]